MATNDTKTLHEKHDPRWPIGQLISMMDMLGGTITCDDCGRWQRLGTLLETEAIKIANDAGWLIKDGRDLCPICAAGRRS